MSQDAETLAYSAGLTHQHKLGQHLGQQCWSKQQRTLFLWNWQITWSQRLLLWRPTVEMKSWNPFWVVENSTASSATLASVMCSQSRWCPYTHMHSMKHTHTHTQTDMHTNTQLPQEHWSTHLAKTDAFHFHSVSGSMILILYRNSFPWTGDRPINEQNNKRKGQANLTQPPTLTHSTSMKQDALIVPSNLQWKWPCKSSHA